MFAAKTAATTQLERVVFEAVVRVSARARAAAALALRSSRAWLLRRLSWRSSRLTLPADQRLLYSALIEQALSEAARKAMEMDSQVEKFFSEEHRRSFDRGKAEGEAKGKAEGEAKGKAEGEAKGKAEGEAKALLMFLRRRGLAVTDDQQQQIVGCADLPTLDRWLERAFSVTSVEELLA